MSRLLPASVVLLAATGACTPEPEVSWHQDISPMMQERCVRCHSPVGQGVGDFTDLETVRTFSGRMIARMDEGTMPPPVADPDCRDYVGSDHLNMPDAEKDLFREWVALDMPEGNPELAPVLDLPALTLEGADMELQPPEPYLPAFADPQNPGNEYRCFVLDHGRDEDFFITGFDPIVDEPQLVHHVLLLLIDEDEVPDDYDPAVGQDCIGGRSALGNVAGMVAGWAPGMQPVRFDDGRGIEVKANQKLVVQTHLFRKGPEVDGLTDRTGWRLRTADSVDTPMLMAPLGYYNFNIPAGEGAYTYDGSAGGEGPFELPVSGTAHAIFPHMHVLGTSYKLSVELPDGSEECIVQGDYDFDNQLSYILKEPLGLPRGSKIKWECTWDNSADNPNQFADEPQDVRYGERTDEEMCYAFSLVSAGLP